MLLSARGRLGPCLGLRWPRYAIFCTPRIIAGSRVRYAVFALFRVSPVPCSPPARGGRRSLRDVLRPHRRQAGWYQPGWGWGLIGLIERMRRLSVMVFPCVGVCVWVVACGYPVRTSVATRVVAKIYRPFFNETSVP